MLTADLYLLFIINQYQYFNFTFSYQVVIFLMDNFSEWPIVNTAAR